MKIRTIKKDEWFSIIGFSLILSFVVAYLIRGNLVRNFLENNHLNVRLSMTLMVISLLCGLLISGFAIKSISKIRDVLVYASTMVVIASIPYFLGITYLFLFLILLTSFNMGLIFSIWGFYLKHFTLRKERIRYTALLLMFINVFSVIINVLNYYVSKQLSFATTLVFVVIGVYLVLQIPLESINEQPIVVDTKRLFRPMALFLIFLVIISINMGISTFLIRPSFYEHHAFVHWFWIIPYLLVILLMSVISFNLKKRLYFNAAIISMILAMVCYSWMDHNLMNYFIIDSLLMISFGIFDLFWLSILSEIIDYVKYPIRFYGAGISAHIIGLLFGMIIGGSIEQFEVLNIEIGFIAMLVLLATSILLPSLNMQLQSLLDSQAFLAKPNKSSTITETSTIESNEYHQLVDPIEPLTPREKETLQYILSGASNKAIAEALFISESTVKTHVRNIFTKYEVGTRSELLSKILQK